MFTASTETDRTLLLDIQEGVKQLNLQATADASAYEKPHMIMPFTLDPDFICRPSIEQWMKEQFTRPTQRMALVGMGGFGYAPCNYTKAILIREQEVEAGHTICAPNLY